MNHYVNEKEGLIQKINLGSIIMNEESKVWAGRNWMLLSCPFHFLAEAGFLRVAATHEKISAVKALKSA